MDASGAFRSLVRITGPGSRFRYSSIEVAWTRRSVTLLSKELIALGRYQGCLLASLKALRLRLGVLKWTLYRETTVGPMRIWQRRNSSLLSPEAGSS